VFSGCPELLAQMVRYVHNLQTFRYLARPE